MSAFELEWDKLPHYELKWPLTRAERLKELEEMSVHYEKTDQRDNIRAAKAWHAQFPPDQIVPEETIYFVNGQKVDESEVDDHEGWVWEEVSGLSHCLYSLDLIIFILGCCWMRLYVWTQIYNSKYPPTSWPC